MEPIWYHSWGDDPTSCFIVFADTNNTCSRRRFAEDGTFLDEARGVAGAGYADYFVTDLRSAQRLGSLQGRPNLQDAVKRGRLPNDALGELRRLKRAMIG